MDTFSLQHMNFIDSAIGSMIGVSDNYDKDHFEKISQKYPEHEGWTAIFNFRGVTVDFSKLSAFLSTAEESTPPPAKRGTSSIESAGDTKAADPKSQHEQLTQSSPTRGRPREYDWDAILREIVLLANTPDGLPKTQAELERWVAVKCRKLFGKEPDPSLIRKHVGPIYQRIRSKS